MHPESQDTSPPGSGAGATPAPPGRAAEAAAALARVGHDLAGTLDLAQAADRVVSTVLRVFGGRRAVLYERDPERGTLTCVAAAGDVEPEEWVGRVMPPGAGLAALAVAEGRAVCSTNLAEDPRIQLPDWAVEHLRREGYRFAAAVPLLARGEPVGVLAMGDVPGRTLSEEDLDLFTAFADQAALALQNARLHTAALGRVRALAALVDVSRAVTSTLDIGAVAKAVIEAAQTLLPDCVCHLWEVNPGGDELTLLAGSDSLAATGGHVARLQPGQGLAGIVVQTREPVVSRDLVHDDRFLSRSWAAAEGLASAIVLPLLHTGSVYGTLNLFTRRPHEFTTEELRLLEAFASQAGAAIANARLYELVQRRLRQTETLLAVSQSVGSSLELTETMRRVAQETGRALGSDTVGAYIADPDESVLRPLAGYHIPKPYLDTLMRSSMRLRGHPFVEEAWTHHRPVFSSDAGADPRIDPDAYARAPHRSVAFLPMVVKGRAIGGLFAIWWEERHTFTPEELRLAQVISGQAALAVANARLYGEAERRRMAAESLADLGRLVSQSLDPADVAQRVADSVRTLLAVQNSTLYRLEPDSGDLVALGVSGDIAGLAPGRIVFPRGTGVVGLAVRERQPVVTPDVLADPRVSLTPEARARIERVGYRAVLAVPLVVKDAVIGALAVGDRAGRVFDGEDLRVAGAFADQAAIALENARLYAEATGRRRESEVLARLAQTLSESLDVTAVGQRIVQSVLPLFGVRSSSLALLQADGSRVAIATAGPGSGIFEVGCVMPSGVGVSGRAVLEGRPVWSADVLREPDAGFPADVRDRIEESGTHAVLAAPLRAKGEIIGVLAIGDRAGRRFSPAETALLQTFADQAALALQNARLYGEVKSGRDFLRSITENSIDGIVTTDERGRVTYVSPGAEEMFGYRAEEILGRPVGDYYRGGAEEARRVMGRARTEGRIRSYETALRGKDDRWVEVGIAVSLLRDPAGGIVGTLGVIKDVTERRRLEEQLRQAQKMEAVGQLAGGIAHDFNNLLTVIMGYNDLTLASLPGGDPLRESAEQIRHASERAARLVHQLLAFGRKQVLQPRLLDLNAVLAGMEPMLARLIGEHIELRRALAPAPSLVQADPVQIEQVVLNLAVNARDAMPRGGTLTLETALVELDEAFVRSHPGASPGPHAMLAVADTGVGMDAGVQARIFEPFFTTRGPGQGTGLGLATVYGIVKQSGGYIRVRSEPGHGSRFEIYLPRVEGPAPRPPGEPAAVASPPGSETILLAEDDDGVRDLSREILRTHGYVVLEAQHGVEALEVAARHQGPIHLLVTDVVMPRMGGRELAESLTALRPETRVLYVSGHTDDAVLHHGVRAAGAAFLQKPFTPDTLARKVGELLGRA